MIAEFRIYLEQNFCLGDWDDCKVLVEEHFTGMHTMAMESSSYPLRSACRSQSVEAAQPSHQSQLTAPMHRSFSRVFPHE